MSASDETVIHIRQITSTKTTSNTKKGNIHDLHFLIVVVFHQDRNQHKEPAGSAPWFNQTSQFISTILCPNAKLNCFPAFFDQLIQTNCCNIVGSLKNPDRWRAKTDPPRLPSFILFSLHHWLQPDLLFLCTDFDPDSHLKRTSIRKCMHFLLLLRIKVEFEWMSTYSFWAAREITSMFLVFDFLRSGVFLSKLWEAICV